MRAFATSVWGRLRPQVEQVVEHTLSALLTVAAVAALHVAVGWIAAMTGLAHDGDHDLRLWDFLPVRYIFDAGHFAVLLRWVINCVRVAWHD